MSMPTYIQMIEPLLRYLAAHPDGAPAAEAQQHLASYFALGAEELKELLPGGSQQVYKNRAGWAHDRLKRARLSSSPKRGLWQATADGVELVRSNPNALPATALDRIWRVSDVAQALAVGQATDAATSHPTETRSPDEQLESAAAEIRGNVARDLLELVGKMAPHAFEELVLRLLHGMGYGASRSDLKRTGGTGDGGIDGIISLDRLGLERVYVQAKRWQSSVGGPQLREFMGALQENHANKGVFLTTSTFTAQAKEAAGRASSRIVLIDGSSLAELMIDHQVGVSHRVVVVPKVDLDTFE